MPFADQGTELDVDGGQHLREHLDLRYPNPPSRQALGHLQADVPGTDDQGGCRLQRVEGAGEGERVAHRVQQVQAVVQAKPFEAGDWRPDWDGAGADDQLVVVQP